MYNGGFLYCIFSASLCHLTFPSHLTSSMSSSLLHTLSLICSVLSFFLLCKFAICLMGIKSILPENFQQTLDKTILFCHISIHGRNPQYICFKANDQAPHMGDSPSTWQLVCIGSQSYTYLLSMKCGN